MKKKIILSFALLLIIVGLALVLYTFWQRRQVPIETVLPEGPDAYIRVLDMEDKVKTLTKTEFWAILRQMDIRATFKKLGASSKDLATFDKVFNQPDFPPKERAFYEFFGQEAAVAFYLPQKIDLGPGFFEKIASGMVIVTRPKANAELLESLGTLVVGMATDADHTEIKYKNHRIHMIKPKDQELTLGYARIGDLLVLGIGEQPIRRCWDVYDKTSPSLAQDSRYLDVKANYLSQADSTGFMNLGSIATFIKKAVLGLAAYAQQDAQKIQQMMKERLDQMFGFSHIGYSGVFGPPMRVKVDLFYDQNDLKPEWRSLYDCRPRQNQSLSFVPKDALWYQWGTCYDFNYFWRQTEEQLQQTPHVSADESSPAEALVSLEKKINLDFKEEILPVLGDEVGQAVLAVDSQGFFPVPETLLFVRIIDKDQAVKVTDRLVASFGAIRMETESYKGHTINFYNIPLLTNLRPSYAFVDDYFVLSTRPRALRRAIDGVTGSSATLRQHPVFEDTTFDLAGENNAVLFVDSPRLASQLDGAIMWGNQWLDAQHEQREAFRRGQEQVLEEIRQELAEEASAKEKMDADLAQQLREKETQVPVEAEIQNVDERLLKRKEILADAGVGNDQDEELARLERRRDALLQRQKKHQVLAEKINRLKQDIRNSQAKITARREKEQAIQQIIVEYDQSRQIPPETRQTLVTSVIRPLLQAFGKTVMLANKMICRRGAVEVYFFLEFH